uniref:Calpain catalytic domain-containing protein n=1 Tax=Ditylenchus dipsaci TaxID=166011 RepID=A0A915D651_9BILA
MSPRKDRAVTWLRPHQICKKPQLIVDGNSRFDGGASQPELHQKYAGIFHFQFWRYGRWVDVVVDDRLPVRTGTNRLVYMSSATPNEFWSPLLEKAYAKLNGSYEALEGGHSSDAMEDMTGGLAERLTDLMQIKRSLIKQIYSSNQMGSLMGCSMGRNSLADSNHRMPNGLITSHAYSITDAKNIGSASSPMWLLRIRNPWVMVNSGMATGQTTPSNGSRYPLNSRMNTSLLFLMMASFGCLLRTSFATLLLVEICHLGPDVMEEVCDLTGLEKRRLLRSAIWVSAILHSNWRVSEGTAGGHLTSHSSLKSFWKNPQFLFRVKPNPAARKHMSTVIVALMQKYRRRHKSEGWENLVIGFEVYKGQIGELQRGDVSLWLDPGEYVIVPCTQQPNQDADFMLRLFSNGIFTKQLEQLPK